MKIIFRDEHGKKIITLNGDVPRINEFVFINLKDVKTYDGEKRPPVRKVTEISRNYKWDEFTQQYEEYEVNVYTDNLGH